MNCLVIEDLLGKDVYRISEDCVRRVFRNISRLEKGKCIKIAFLGGERGNAEIVAVSSRHIDVKIVSLEPSLPLLPIDLIVGLSRPQTTKKVIQAAVMTGVRSLHLVNTANGEKSYKDATLLREDGLKVEIVKALEQIWQGSSPQIFVHHNFRYFQKNTLQTFADYPRKLIAVPENEMLKADVKAVHIDSTVVAVGPEAGWSEAEVVAFEEVGFRKIGLGRRTVRVELAVAMVLGQVVMITDTSLESNKYG